MGRPSRGARLTASHRAVLRVPAYRRLVAAALVSRFGDVLQWVALPLLVYAVSASPAAVSLVVAAEGAGLIAGSALAQVVADTVAPRQLLVTSDLLRAAAALLLVAVPAVPVAAAVAAALAVGTGCFSPASAGLIPRLVDDELLPAANALLWTAGVALQTALAPLGGLLVAASSARLAFALNAASFAASALILRRLPHLEAAAGGTPAGPRPRPISNLLEGARLVLRVTVMPPLLAMQALAALSVGATSALLVVLARSAYGMGPAGYGLWLGLIAAGALAGPFLVPKLLLRREHRLVGAAYIVRGAGDIGMAALRSPAAGAGILAVYGLCTSSGMVAYQTLVQRRVPEAMRGRALALLDGTWQAARLASIGLGGAAAGAVGTRPVYAVGGALLLLAGAVGATALPAP